MKSSHYEISLQKGTVHMLEAFLKILILLLFIIAVGPGCQQVPTLGLPIHISQETVLAKRASIAIGRRKHCPLRPHAENKIVSTWALSVISLHKTLLNSNHRNYVFFSQIYHLHLLVRERTLADDVSAEAHYKHFGLYKRS